MKVVITNVVLSNSGDAAICMGIVDSFLRAGVVARHGDITILDDNAAVTSGLYPELRVLQQPLVRRGGSRAHRLTQLSRNLVTLGLFRVVPGLPAGPAGPAVRAYLDADVVVSTGGTYLVEHYRMLFRLIELLLVPRSARVVLWTQSMGPFHRLTSRALVRRVAKRARLVLLRDEKSRGYLREVAGDSDRFLVAVDAAFGMDVPGADPAQPRNGCVVSVREWGLSLDGRALDGSTDYERAIVSAATVFQKASPSAWVRALSTCQGVRGYRNDDSVLARRMFGDTPFVTVDGDFHRPREILDVLLRSRVVIATRMHMAIMALMAGCQVVAIAYEFKSVELFNLLGFPEHVVVLEECTPDSLVRIVSGLLADDRAGRLTPEQIADLRDAAFPSAATRVIHE